MYHSINILDLFLFLSIYLKATLSFIYFIFSCSLLVPLMMTRKRLNEDDDRTHAYDAYYCISSFIFLCGVLKT